MNQDFKDLLHSLNEAGAKYLIVGGHAVIEYTEPRYTKDLDVWVMPSKSNAKKVFTALEEFGAPLNNLTIQDLSTKGLIFQIGVAPIRIDIITNIASIDFEEAWKEKLTVSIDSIPMHIIGKRHLIISKEVAGRPQDLIDLQNLKLK